MAPLLLTAPIEQDFAWNVPAVVLTNQVFSLVACRLIDVDNDKFQIAVAVLPVDIHHPAGLPVGIEVAGRTKENKSRPIAGRSDIVHFFADDRKAGVQILIKRNAVPESKILGSPCTSAHDTDKPQHRAKTSVNTSACR